MASPTGSSGPFSPLFDRLLDPSRCSAVTSTQELLDLCHERDLGVCTELLQHLGSQPFAISTDLSSLAHFLATCSCLTSTLLVRASTYTRRLSEHVPPADLIPLMEQKISLLTSSTRFADTFGFHHAGSTYEQSALLTAAIDRIQTVPAVDTENPAWPTPDTNLSSLIPASYLYAPFSVSLSFGFATFPPAGIIAAFGLLNIVAAGRPQQRLTLHSATTSNASSLGENMQALYMTLWQGNIPQSCNSAYCLQMLALHAAIAAILQCYALYEIANDREVTLPVLTTGPDIPSTKEYILEALNNRSTLTPIVLGKASTTPGATSSKGTAAEGKKYILSQFKIPRSAYRMPSKDATQDQWELWFKKVADLPNQFDIPISNIIFLFTGHLDNTHRPTYGWHDEATKLQGQNIPITLEHFFAHIRHQLFPAPSTRHQACQELHQIPEAIKSGKFSDCLAFSTYVKTLWSKLFPTEPTSERSPIQQYQACIVLHRIMSGIFDLPFSLRKTNVFVHAWCKVRYDNLDIHSQYLDQSLHALTYESDAMCAQFLDTLHGRILWILYTVPRVVPREASSSPNVAQHAACILLASSSPTVS